MVTKQKIFHFLEKNPNEHSLKRIAIEDKISDRSSLSNRKIKACESVHSVELLKFWRIKVTVLPRLERPCTFKLTKLVLLIEGTQYEVS